MSPSVQRVRTARALTRARALYGDLHPATWAAYGRAVFAWAGAHRIREIAPTLPSDSPAQDSLRSVATLAWERLSQPGYYNRGARRHAA